jgi:hypothetical protein
VRKIQERRTDNLIVLKNAPLNVAFLPELSVSINLRVLELVREQAPGLLKHLKSMSQLSSREHVIAVDRRIERCASRLALVIGVLPTKEQQVIPICVCKASSMFN